MEYKKVLEHKQLAMKFAQIAGGAAVIFALSAQYAATAPALATTNDQSPARTGNDI